MPLQFDTVAIPVTKGINVNTRARLVEHDTLLEAVNSRFTRGGSAKRRGHEARRIRSTTALPENVDVPTMEAPSSWVNYDTSDRGIPEEWLVGWGAVYGTPTRELDEAIEVGPHPDAALIFGTASRDNEVLYWNGHQLLSRTPGQQPGAPLTTVGPAVMPILRSTPIAKSSRAQENPDGGDTGVIRVVAWIDGTDCTYSVLDSATGATHLASQALGHVDADSVRVVSIGGYIHIIVFDNDSDTLTMHTIHEDSPLTRSSQSLGPCAVYYDVAKVDSNLWGIARNHNDGTILVSWHTASGSGADRPSLTYTPAAAFFSVALGAHPTTDGYALAWSGSKVFIRTFDEDGTALTAEIEVQAAEGPASYGRLLTIAPKYLTDAGDAVYNVHWTNATDGRHTWIARVSDSSTTYEYRTTRYNVELASQAFRCGDRTFVWITNPISLHNLQRSLILVDEALLPVGHCNYAVYDSTPATAHLTTANWTGDVPVKDLLVYHFAFGYRVRVAIEDETQGTTPTPVYAEPSINWVEMDFLPRLVSAQAGRCTYFAGAQLWVYDGQELTEAGFHLAPELEVDPVQSDGTGALTPMGEYVWRVDLCYRNAQNEEIRSHSFFTDSVELTGTNDTVTLTIQTTITRRTNSYFLIFRNPSQETNWYLSNSRDPSDASFVKNDPNQRWMMFADDGNLNSPTDTQLATRELHPGNAGFNYVQPYSAPACEVVAVGQDRLWVAGGEIPPGQVYPSRLYDVSECPSFNPSLVVQVDRSNEPITAVGFVGEIAYFFRKNSAYILDSDGPDNTGGGGWGIPRLALSDVGAVSQHSLGRVALGLLFQSPAGIRLASTTGGAAPIGTPVDSLAKALEITSCVVVGEDQEVRWYSRSGTTLVYNYQFDTWSTWTIAAAGAVKNPSTGLAIVATPTGYEWVETEGCWLDNGAPYTHRVRFAWIRAGSLVDFQRVRRFAGVGESASEHNIHVDVYYDERDFVGETFDWSYPEDADDSSWNTDTFGSNDFGDGYFGDTGEATALRDSVWRWRRRPQRQKCSVISIAIDDRGTEGEGFVLTALALEIGRKSGLDRIPWRGGNSGAIGNGR